MLLLPNFSPVCLALLLPLPLYSALPDISAGALLDPRQSLIPLLLLSCTSYNKFMIILSQPRSCCCCTAPLLKRLLHHHPDGLCHCQLLTWCLLFLCGAQLCSQSRPMHPTCSMNKNLSPHLYDHWHHPALEDCQVQPWIWWQVTAANWFKPVL